MCEDYGIGGRRSIGVMNHSHSFCYMEDTWLEHWILSKSVDPSRSRILREGSQDKIFSAHPPQH